MRKSPQSKKLIAPLITIALAIGVLAVVSGSQMVMTQMKVSDLQSQLAYYENMTDNLESQVSNLEIQRDNLQNPIDNVTLTIDAVESWYGSQTTGYYKFINITLQNLGTRSIGGMTIDFRVEGNTTNLGYYGIYVNTNQGVLHTEESRSLRIRLSAWTLETKWELEDCRAVIRLLLDEIVLDSKTVTIG